MPIDPNIPLGVRPQGELVAPINPLDAYGKVLQLKNLIGQQQLLPGQLKAQQQENENRAIQNETLQRNLDIQKDIDASMKIGFGSSPIAAAPTGSNGTSPAASPPGAPPTTSTGTPPSPSTQPTMSVMPDFNRVVQELYSRGRGQAAMAMQKQVAENGKMFSDLRTAQITQAGKSAEILGQVLGGSKNQDDWNSGTVMLHNLGVDTSTVPPIFDPKVAADYAQRGMAYKDQVETKGKELDDWIKANTAGSTVAKAGSEASTAASEATLAANKVNLANLPASSWVSQVDSIPNLPPSYASMVKSKVSFAANAKDPAAAQKALDEASEYSAAPGKAAAVAAATAPINISEAVAKETDPRVIAARTNQAVTTAKALRMGDNPAIQRVPPAEVGSVMTQAQKLDEAAIKANSATEAIGKVLDLATAGNKAAGANLPLLGVGAENAVNGIKRINSAEISQYGTAGSLLDSIQGRLQKWTTGQPIPQDVLDDMRTLHQMLGEQGYKTYTDSLNSLNDRTGAAFKPNVAPPNIRKGPVAPIQLKDGTTLTPHDQAAADQFRKDHPELIK